MLSLFLAMACSMPMAVQEDTCDMSCHKNKICPQIARICESCRRRATACGAHASLCYTCAKAQNVCPFCRRKMTDPAAKSRREALRRAVAEALAGHRLGRKVPLGDLALEGAEFFYVFHPTVPCETCEEYLEPLAVYEPKAGKARVIESEQELEALLKRHRLSGKDVEDLREAARLAARLVQALWDAKEGDLEGVKDGKLVGEEEVELSKTPGGSSAVFEYSRGKKRYRLTVHFDLKGRFSSLSSRPVR